jgi:DNA-binding NarL/FixJ family response regulator
MSPSAPVSNRDLILIVDDDAETRTLLFEALGRAGFDCLLAAGGAAALDLARGAGPNLIVLDALMPGMSGFDACRALKAQPGFVHLPVIFLTGLTQTEHVVEGLRAGGVDYVTKPIILDELIARIRVHLANARMAQSARAALDVAGRSLLAADREGRFLWGTPQTAELLAAMPGDGLPAPLRAALASLAARSDESGAQSVKVQAGDVALELAYLGRTGEEFYFRLNRAAEGLEADVLKVALGLTAREAEVLLWISGGKSNKDISDILNISHRTVNKHLEHIFTKLGVENRAAAAAIATRIIAAR